MTLDCSGINKDGPGRLRTEADKPDFVKLVILMLLMMNRTMSFVSQRINSSKADGRIQFKIIHLKSKTNSEETFDATEELRNLNKNNSAGTSGDKKKRAKTIFGTNFRDAPLNN